MAGSAVFRVINPRALRTAIVPATQMVANELAAAAVSLTPADTGALRSGWHVSPGRVPGVYIVENSTPYGRYVEFGTKDDPARHMLGIAAGMMRGRYATR